MSATFKRWQDYVTMALGVIMVIAPVFFSETAQTTAAYTAYALGALLFISGLLAATRPTADAVEYLPVVIGIVLFVAPFVLGFTAITGTAWTAWIVGVLAIVVAGSLLAFPGRSIAGHKVT